MKFYLKSFINYCLKIKNKKLPKGEENILLWFVFFKIKFIVLKIFAIKREPGRKESKRYLFATDQINKILVLAIEHSSLIKITIHPPTPFLLVFCDRRAFLLGFGRFSKEKQSEASMGQAFRKLFDTFFGNSEMRVHKLTHLFFFFL